MSLKHLLFGSLFFALFGCKLSSSFSSVKDVVLQDLVTNALSKNIAIDEMNEKAQKNKLGVEYLKEKLKVATLKFGSTAYYSENGRLYRSRCLLEQVGGQLRVKRAENGARVCGKAVYTFPVREPIKNGKIAVGLFLNEAKELVLQTIKPDPNGVSGIRGLIAESNEDVERSISNIKQLYFHIKTAKEAPYPEEGFLEKLEKDLKEAVSRQDERIQVLTNLATLSRAVEFGDDSNYYQKIESAVDELFVDLQDGKKASIVTSLKNNSKPNSPVKYKSLALYIIDLKLAARAGSRIEASKANLIKMLEESGRNKAP